MGKPRVAVAAGSRLGTQAAANVARQGGNAVDSCIASAIMGWVAEPFFASIGGSAFVSIHSPDGTVEVFDGNNTMPSTDPAQAGAGITRVHFAEYADGMYTGVGGGSVGVPGAVAALAAAWERHGKIEWPALFEDAIRAARDGILFPRTSAYYLSVTWDPLWSHYEGSRTLFSHSGRPLMEDDPFVQPELAESLQALADEGASALYGGKLGRAVVDEITAHDGFMTLEDLRTYEATARPPLTSEAYGWVVQTNPPPAVGGVVMTHMLALVSGADLSDPIERLRVIVEAQREATSYRRERYQDPTGIAAAFQEAMAALAGSEDTTHSSAADSDGYVCSLSESNGYGAGLVARGILLNNGLGEEELNPLGVHSLPAGQRCHSNMAPTIVAGPDRIVGLGSPGADRIVGAVVQSFLRMAVDGADLKAAVSAPRAHLDPRPEGETLCFEPGLPGDSLGFRTRPYDEIHMYFGAVQAASVTTDGAVDAAHDPRRSGGSALV